MRQRIEQPDYIVFRFDPSVPTIANLDGVWFDRSRFPTDPFGSSASTGRHMVARPTGRFELRDDGCAVAEVWLVNWSDADD